MRGNLSTFADIYIWWQVMVDTIVPVVTDAELMKTADEVLPCEPWDNSTWGISTSALKERSGLGGKASFMPLRQALTGQEHGPEIRLLLPMIGQEKTLARLQGATA